MFRKTLALVLALALWCLIPAWAEPTGSEADPAESFEVTMNAVVAAPRVIPVTAPFAGTLLPFDWTVGQRVEAGDALMELDTVKVYAPQTGTLGAMFARPGDDASALAARYGALCLIEPANPLYVDASTANAYNDSENKYLHAGETLYLKCGGDTGKGRVTGVSGNSYSVEILEGDFELGDTVRCYRDSQFTSRSATGSGKARRYADVPVNASGRVFRVHKGEGDAVAAGDLLFELIDAASAPATSSLVVRAPAAGAISQLHAATGAQVYQGQLLMEITDLSALELSVQMDEMYLPGIAVGGTLTFELDAFAPERMQGAVTSIRPLGESRQNVAYFDVRVALPADRGILPGMNATVYLEQPASGD